MFLNNSNRHDISRKFQKDSHPLLLKFHFSFIGRVLGKDNKGSNKGSIVLGRVLLPHKRRLSKRAPGFSAALTE